MSLVLCIFGWPQRCFATLGMCWVALQWQARAGDGTWRRSFSQTYGIKVPTDCLSRRWHGCARVAWPRSVLNFRYPGTDAQCCTGHLLAEQEHWSNFYLAQFTVEFRHVRLHVFLIKHVLPQAVCMHNLLYSALVILREVRNFRTTYRPQHPSPCNQQTKWAPCFQGKHCAPVIFASLPTHLMACFFCSNLYRCRVEWMSGAVPLLGAWDEAAICKRFEEPFQTYACCSTWEAHAAVEHLLLFLGRTQSAATPTTPTSSCTSATIIAATTITKPPARTAVTAAAIATATATATAAPTTAAAAATTTVLSLLLWLLLIICLFHFLLLFATMMTGTAATGIATPT